MFRWCSVLIFLFFLAIQSAECADCPEGWTYYGGNCYVLLRDSMTWYEAKVACDMVHAKLAEVANADQNTFLTSLLKTGHAASYAWLGLEDLVVEGKFVWASDGSSASYQNFHHGELNSGDREDCVSIKNTGEWFDDHCHGSSHAALCQAAAATGGGEESFSSPTTPLGGDEIVG